MAKQLLGKEVTAALNERIKANVAELQGKGYQPDSCASSVLARNRSDISYERGATKRCETLGVACEKILLPEDVTQEELLAAIDKVNKDDHYSWRSAVPSASETSGSGSRSRMRLHPAKDVDCMTDLSMSGVLYRKDKSVSRHVHHRHAWRSLITTESTAQAKKPLSSEEAL